MEEMNFRAADLKCVRLADYLIKRSGSFPYGWNRRYCVVSANFLLVYGNAQVRDMLSQTLCIQLFVIFFYLPPTF